MPFAHANADLQRDFLVVHWDQRGAGKSYSPALNEGDLCIEQLISDTHELILWLGARFQKSSVVLVGHSWGSALGAIVAARFPDLVSAFVGLGQVTNLRDSEAMRFHQAVGMARQLGDCPATMALHRLGPPPYATPDQSDLLERCAQRLSSRYYAPITPATFLRLALSSPVYSWFDVAQIPLGRRLSERCFWAEIFRQIDLFAQVPRLDMPVYFLVGRHDSIVTHELARRYSDALEAPRGKTFVTFERSGHWPHLEESELFRSVLTGPVLRHAASRMTTDRWYSPDSAAA